MTRAIESIRAISQGRRCTLVTGSLRLVAAADFLKRIMENLQVLGSVNGINCRRNSIAQPMEDRPTEILRECPDAK
jgi:hypothetical protein